MNNPEIAALEGKRFVVVNEAAAAKGTKSSSSKDAQPLNINLIKRLASVDDPITATGKYRDPGVFEPQMLLSFFANKAPVFPKDDGGVSSRLSYLFMPFTFVPNPDPLNPMQKPMDKTIKTNAKAGNYNAEALWWMPKLTPWLMDNKSSRQIMPRPTKVCEDSASHFTNTDAANSDTDGPTIVKAFVTDNIIKWDKIHGRPSTREEINQAFREYCRLHFYPDMNPSEVFNGILAGSEGTTRFKVYFEGGNIAVFKARDPLGTLYAATLRTKRKAEEEPKMSREDVARREQYENPE